MTSENFSQDGNSLKLDGSIIYTPTLTRGEPGEQGLKGEKGDKGDSLTYDRLTPNQKINLKGEPGDKGERGLDGQKGLKGDKGDSGLTVIPHITATATIDNTIDQPHVDVVVGGSDENPVLNFKFKGLRGYNGTNGTNGINADPYDDSNLREYVDTLIANEEQRIRNLINTLDEEIKEDVIDMVDQSEFWQEHLPEDVIGGNSNFGQDDVKQYLQQLGLWYNSDGATYTKWSSISQDVDAIKLDVRELKENTPSGETEPIDYESLSASLYAYIDDHQSESGLQSTWTKFLKLNNDEIQMLEWISSGVRSVASSEQAITELFSAAKNSQAGIEAYSGLSTRVSNIEGNYVSTASLTTAVNSAISSSMSGLITESTLNSAIATLNSRIDNIETGTSSQAGLVTEATFNNAVAALNSRITTLSGEINESGVITESNLDGAIAELFARNSSTKACVTALVDSGGSSITIDADNINLDGQTNFLDAIGQKITVSSFAATNILDNVQILLTNSGLTMRYPDGSGQVFQLNPAGQFILSNGTIQYGGGDIIYIGYNAARNLQVNGNITTTSTDNEIHTNKLYSLQSDAKITLLDNSGGTINLSATVVTANGNVISSSDENLKNIIQNIDNVYVEQIANVRTINYEFKNRPGYIKSGTIAQDWQHILPNTVTPIDDEYHLGLDYSSAALISSVIDAREIVKLKQENEELKQRLAIIEERLANL